MAVYVNPETGNHEVWDKKPDGYLTPEAWAADHPAPGPDPEEERRARIEAIKTELASLDLASIRPLRSIDNGDDTPADHAKLVDLEARAAELRAELKAGANG